MQTEPLQKLSVVGALERGRGLVQFFEQEIAELNIEISNRNLLAVACFHVAIEHQKAVLSLIALDLSGSGFALVRSVFEACVRGFWIRYCASSRELDRVLKDRNIGQFEDLLVSIEGVEGFGVGVLMGIKKRSWKHMNSFTHTGMLQISRRFSTDFIEPNYSDDEKIDVINFCSAIGCVVAIAICEVAKDSVRADAILKKAIALGFGAAITSMPQ